MCQWVKQWFAALAQLRRLQVQATGSTSRSPLPTAQIKAWTLVQPIDTDKAAGTEHDR